MKYLKFLIIILSINTISIYAQQPNIVYILVDDLGVGDISALNNEGKIKTPNIDQLTKEGMTFTDAHSGASVCTPTRYGLLTGRYAWRTTLKSRVVNSYANCLIPKERATVASLAKKNGYNTAMIGKWHLGLNWQSKTGNNVSKNLNEGVEEFVDFSKKITLGPNELGFDYWYGTGASWDFPPYAFIENNLLLENEKLVATDDDYTPSIYPKALEEKMKATKDQKTLKKLKNSYPINSWRKGVQLPEITKEHGLTIVANKAANYINHYNSKKPLFLYIPLTAPHTPVSPTEKFKGSSKCGIYGDFVQELDFYVGKIINSLKEKGMYENTLLIFTADNGASLKAIPMAEQKKYNHSPSGIYSGYKARLTEGGHRVPFIATWPKVIAKNSTCDSLISLNDLYATMADLFNNKITDNEAEDSFSMLWALKGKSISDNEKRTVDFHHSFAGDFAFRKGTWKADFKTSKLFNLDDDIKETNNLKSKYPEKYEELRALASSYIFNGRTTQGEKQSNEGPKVWKQIKNWAIIK
ncbi:hypothetical protein AXE80_11545 [Wenyingzhuangia fucanilytica]|uniref:Sulfatase N-terminal domain-containing protein n=1 Tax=Wenyingzhuangia fucanilytica TaxID=1790137 RepID=A0A1B1Y7Z5_9FLAO|nr:sulfatase-like hydrolase/transferase [Wenyingzhuangia fucanilytica]ANW96877.1 hypothetical protein AXE80_11545 [Wenyingzhuangia fucanilytica]